MIKIFEVIDFRFVSTDDKYDLKYKLSDAWSRVYEYKYVYDFIVTQNKENPQIHNSSWGFGGVHVVFRDEIDLIGNCLHSDINESKLKESYYYDITKIDNNLLNKFDFVVNISTIEHLNSSKDMILAIQNLYDQLKPTGYLILTFDYPRVDLDEIEKFLGIKCEKCDNMLNGTNSIYPNTTYENLNIVYLILQKNG